MPARARSGWATWQLFAIAVAVWSTTWHAILYQLEHTPPEIGVALRFALAGALALGIAALRGERPVPLTWLGAALAVAGNVLILRPRAQGAPPTIPRFFRPRNP